MLIFYSKNKYKKKSKTKCEIIYKKRGINLENEKKEDKRSFDVVIAFHDSVCYIHTKLDST